MDFFVIVALTLLFVSVFGLPARKRCAVATGKLPQN